MFDAKIILERTAPCIVVDAGKHGQDLPQTLQDFARVSLSPALPSGATFLHAGNASGASAIDITSRHAEPCRTMVPENQIFSTLHN
jgi:hypothetical protein